MPPSFYNLGDQAIYSAGDFFIPQEKYRAAPYNVNKPAPDDPAAAGIPAIYQSQGGGGGGGTYTGGISDLTGDFFKTKTIGSNATTELITQPIVLQESEILKAQATTADRLHMIVSLLEINRD